MTIYVCLEIAAERERERERKVMTFLSEEVDNTSPFTCLYYYIIIL